MGPKTGNLGLVTAFIAVPEKKRKKVDYFLVQNRKYAICITC
jgi:hypothetical protein